MKKYLISLCFVVFLVLFTGRTFAQTQNDDRKVRICHNNGQSGNWTSNEVDDDSVDGDDGNDNGQGDHNRAGHQDGRDIIPPFYVNGNTGYWNSRNWDATGESIWRNGCSSVFSSPTPTATPVTSATPSATPTVTPRNEDDPTPTPTSQPTPNNGDVCANLEGIQTSLPDITYHFDTTGRNCLQFSDPGVDSSTTGSVLSASTTRGRVLGASTMAATGAFEDALFNSIFTLGSFLTSFGIMKNGKKDNKYSSK